MDCASSLKKLGNSPQGNKLSAIFEGVEIPDSITVKGTSDNEPVRPGGHWISAHKYSNDTATLQLIKNGVVVKECVYSKGNLNNPVCVISNFRISVSNTTVSVDWDVDQELGVSVYSLDRKVSIAGAFDESVQIDLPAGSGVHHTIYDDPGIDEFTYQLRCVFENGSDSVLGEGTVAV